MSAEPSTLFFFQEYSNLRFDLRNFDLFFFLRFAWEFEKPVTGADIQQRLSEELQYTEGDIRSILHGGKKVKNDTIIVKSLTVNLAKKKKEAPKPEPVPETALIDSPPTCNYELELSF